MLTARDIMTTDVVTIQCGATVAEAMRLMLHRGSRALIIHRRNSEDAYGIITESDIVRKVVATGQDPNTTIIDEVMTKPCIVVNPDLGVEHIAKLFKHTNIHQAPVFQEKVIGMVSSSDIIRQYEIQMIVMR